MFRAREVSRGRDLRPPGDSGTVKDVAARVEAEAEPGQRRVGLHAHLPGLPDIDGLCHDDMAVTSVSGRPCAADEAGQVTLRIPGLSCEALPSWRRSWPRERHCAPLKVGPGADPGGWAMSLARCRCQMARLSLLPDVPVKLAGDGRGASTRRWSALALSMRQRGEAPLID